MFLFDFDGVLVDSIDEAIISSYNAVTSRFIYSLSGLPAGFESLMRLNRHHVSYGGDFILLARWSLKNLKLESQKVLSAAEFNLYKKSSEEELSKLTEQLYLSRTQLLARRPSDWYRLHRPYQPLWDRLKDARHDPLVILTSKNRAATYSLCCHFGLKVELEQIHSGDGGATKEDNFLEICQRHGPRKFQFVEDSIENLEALLRLQSQGSWGDSALIPFLATWGYIGPDSLSRAAALGVTPIDQATLVSLLN